MNTKSLRSWDAESLLPSRREQLRNSPWVDIPSPKELAQIQRLGRKWYVSDELLYQLKATKKTIRDPRGRLKMEYADLRATDLIGANLKAVVFRYADLRDSSLAGTQLSGADLRFADLRGANLERTSFGSAKLNGAKIEGAEFGRADLRRAKGLSEVVGKKIYIAGKPRDIEFWLAWETGGSNTTLETELCVLEEKIGSLRQFLHNRDMHASVFLSYSHADKDFVIQLYQQMIDRGISVWLDDKDIDIGSIISEVISEGIKRSWIFVSVLSPTSVKSKWVKHELDEAYHEHVEKGKLILPVLTGKLASEDIPNRLKHIKYADFRDELIFNESFALLIRAINNFAAKKAMQIVNAEQSH